MAVSAAELQILLTARDDASGRLQGLGREVNRVEADVEKASGAFGRLSGVVGKLGSIGLAGAGIGAIVSGFQGAFDAVSGLVTSASDLNEQVSKSGAVFGEASRSVQDFAKTTASALGISQTAALEAAGSFGVLFKTAGLSDEAAAGMSTDLVRLAADLASFNNIDPSEALDKLRSGLVGEAEPLRSVGILLNEAGVQAKALQLGLGGVGRELTEAEKVQARYALIQEQSTRAQGDFARTSTGLANSMRIIRASWADAATTLGQAFLPVVARAAQFLAQELPRALAVVQQVTDQLGPALAALFAGDLQGALDRAVALVGAGAAALAPRLAEWTRAFLDWVQEMAPRLVAFLGERLGDVWAWVRETAPGLLETAVGTWVPAFLSWVAEVGPKVLASLIQLLSELGVWIRDVGAPQVAAFGADLGAALVRGFAKAMEQLGPALDAAIRNALTERPGLGDFLRGAIPAISPAGGALPQVVGGAVGLAGAARTVHVEIQGMDLHIGTDAGDARAAAREAGAAVERRVLEALTQSAASTEPGASTTLTGAGR